MIINLAWVLPRPSKAKYAGGFPLYFEERLLEVLRVNKSAKILHPFGGMAQFGIRCDLKNEVMPDVIADAHTLPFKDNVFDLVVLDPPYSDELAKRLYDTPPIKFRTYTKEAVRVLKEGGYLAILHFIATGPIRGALLIKRIFVEHSYWHHLLCVHIHKKNSYSWMGKRGQSYFDC